ncbi:MAG: nitroreductase family deazaflavin-dependent oxidoreductase [Acidimicrobiales bacterium]
MAIPVSDRIFGKLLSLHQVVYDRSGGRIGASLGGRPMLLLRTTGAKTGKERTAALLYVPDGDDYAVIASKGGDDRHPGWYHNLMADPEVEIQVGTDTIPVKATVAEGPDRTRLWQAADEVNKGQYETYQSRTDRQIPVVVLSPR